MSPTWNECLLSFFDWVIRGSLMAGILVVLVLSLQFLLRKRLEARWKYWLWLPVAIRLLLPWAPESSLSLYNVLPVDVLVPGIQQQTPNPSAWHQWLKGTEGDYDETAQAKRSYTPEKSSQIRGDAEISDPSHKSGTVRDISIWWSGFKQMGFTNLLMLVWLAGVLFLAAKTAYDQLRLNKALRAGRCIDTPWLAAVFRDTKQLMGVKREVRFVASERIPGPAIVGFRKPAIVVSPSLLVTLREHQLRCILAHEFAHIQRRDVAVNWTMHILLILHWFNPMLWLAVHKARQDQEMACDACVLNRMSSEPNLQHIKTYGHTIIHVLEHFHWSGKRHQPGLAGLSATHKQMKKRLLMIKRFHKKSYHLSILGMAIIVALGSVTLVNAKGNDVGAAPSPASSGIGLMTAAAKPKAESEGEKLEKEEIARINELLKKNPFDNYVTYSSFQPKGGRVWGYMNGGGRYDKYEDYLKKVSSVKEAKPQQPADLPEGYTFEEAHIFGPYGSEYVEEMKAEAKKLGKKVYSKKVDWTFTNLIVLTYTNGEDYIQLTSSRLENKDGKEKVKEKDYVYTSAEDNTRKHDMQLGNKVSWKEGGQAFSISTNPDNPLTKEDLIKLAKTMVIK
ncbi:M56 family metallopeptidase [Paenibacillus dendritiformis]|uniref:M56 family metallopeptidase n=1 Tax=Paenibacillus dendritiformis TaxID=130049 RepID=UPI00143D2F99|nr:M56 family metallopeptidase [Paenibacillus dendritiformis]NKI19941.1 M56 family metallopeptidase [Paenibacillus dendritiformis]NRG00272.1 M48 family metalloprotease [Paenibacillus dendritiformis]